MQGGGRGRKVRRPFSFRELDAPLSEPTAADAALPALLADGSAPETPEGLLARLAAAGIAATTVEHPPLYTVEQSKALRGSLPGLHVKNLFLRNQKGAMWLVTCLEDRQVDLKRLAEVLSAGRFSFGSPDRLMKYLGIRPGAVTPFAIVNDLGRQVTNVIDVALIGPELVNAHPLVNDRTTALRGQDLVAFLAGLGRKPAELDFARL